MISTADLVRETAAATDFAGVVRVDRGGLVELSAAFGLADRAHSIPMTTDHQLAVASGSKVFTALTVMSLVADGVLALDTPARSILGTDLPLVPAGVTVEQLLAHRAGIGDYLDEDDDSVSVEDYVMPVPVQYLDSTENFVPILDGHPVKFIAGEQFSYCNAGYVVLALIAERVSGTAFGDLVRQRVSAPAGLSDTAFLRSDALPGRAAIGYLRSGGEWRTNVFHLPVLGSGDGGIYTTAGDVAAFWTALFAGAIVAPDVVEQMVRPISETTHPQLPRYGLGFWLSPSDDLVILEGMDAGVSFRSVHRRTDQLSCTVIGTTAHCAWPMARALAGHLLGTAGPATPLPQ